MTNKNTTNSSINNDQDSWGSRKQIHLLIIMLATALGIYLCYKLAAPFLPVITWALTLAILFVPIQHWFERRIKNSNLATTASVLVISLIVVVPMIFLGTQLITEVVKGADIIKKKIEDGEWRRTFDSHSHFASLRKWIEEQTDLPGALNNLYSWLTSLGASFVQGSVLQLFGLLLTFYLLFYFLRDRKIILQSLHSLSPFSMGAMNRLFKEVSDTVYATIYGTLVVAAVQGTLGGLVFWWLELPAPLLWGLAMSLLAIVPVLGAFVIWIPAAIFLALDGDWSKALILSLWGGIVIAGIDNLLYPILVGTQLNMHTVLVFISLVGGLMIFGPSGLILGPVTLCITKFLLQIWSRRNWKEQAATLSEKQVMNF